MGTSKIYGSPKWPGVNTAVGIAASSGSPSNQKISAAIGAFASAYKNYLTSGTISPGSSGGGGALSEEVKSYLVVVVVVVPLDCALLPAALT